MLEAKIAEVRSGMLARQAADVITRPDDPLDFGDWCHKHHEEWLFLNQNRIELERLRQLEAALDRVRSGDYGVCHRCHEPIAPERLDAVPWAEYCIHCQDAPVEVESESW